MDYDVFIAGGGLAGTSLALALAPAAAAGTLRVALAEAAPPADGEGRAQHDVRALALAEGSRRILETLGVWEAIAPHATAIERIHVSDRGRFGFARLTNHDLGVPALGYTVEIATLAASLWQALGDCRQIVRLCPAVVESAVWRDGHVELGVRLGQEDGGGNTLTTVRARLVVAADGADSRLRAAAGIETEQIAYAQQALVATVALGRPHAHTAYERFTPEGPLAIVPLAGQRAKLIWSTPQNRIAERLAWDDESFLAHLQDNFGERLGTFSQPGPRRAYPLVFTRVATPVRPRLALVGNAAHTVHPVAGQGFNLALRDVAALAEILVQATRRGEDPGAPAVLARYADWRAADTGAVQGLTHLMVRAFANEALPLVLLRDLGLLAVDLIPPLKRRLMRLTSGLAAAAGGRLPRLARGLPLL
jgi:2-octaprenyl-6-methoxyphenol hydroxylase